MTCAEVAELVMAYLADEVLQPQREAFDQHLTGCSACVEYVRGYERAVRLAKGALDDGPAAAAIPEELVEAILAARRKQV